MRTHLVVATTLLIAVAIGPSSALGLSVGAKVGGIGVGASVGTGKNGASAGISARVGGVGGAKAGASVGRNAGSSAGGKVGRVGAGKKGASAGISARGGGVGGAKGAGANTNPGGALGGSAAGASKISGIAPAKGARPSVVLPRNLWPSKVGRPEYDSRDYPSRFPAPTATIPGTARAVVRACRQAIASAASPLGAVRVRAASAGPLHRNRRGALTAPLAVRIDYAGQGGIEIRQARIRCHLDSAGRVVAVI
jgi:hypothetical protein